MTGASIPDDVRAFVGRHVATAEQAEVLLLLRQHAGREWTAAAVAGQLGTSEASVAAKLDDLYRRGFLAAREAPVRRFRYEPGTPELARGTDRLAQAYRQRRVAVVELIFARDRGALRAFADAFRLRREG